MYPKAKQVPDKAAFNRAMTFPHVADHYHIEQAGNFTTLN